MTNTLNKISLLLLLLPILIITACDVEIQRRFKKEKIQCSEYADFQVMPSDIQKNSPSRQNIDKITNQKILHHFSECMAKLGWQVSLPDLKHEDDGENHKIDKNKINKNPTQKLNENSERKQIQQ